MARIWRVAARFPAAMGVNFPKAQQTPQREDAGMSAANILNLNQPMGAKLIRILYCIALVVIALATLSGMVGGVRTMLRPPPMAQTATAAPIGQPPAPPDAANPNRPDFGPGEFRRGRPGMRGPRMDGPMRMRRPFVIGGMVLPPPVSGALRILLALLRGLIAIMIVRVLAEIGTAILAMSARQAP
jgi:hypothetical protein